MIAKHRHTSPFHLSRKAGERQPSHGISIGDLAFGLLVFFVLTLVPSGETGYMMRLEPWSEEPPDTYKVNSRNVFSISIYGSSELFANGEIISYEIVKSMVMDFVSNPTKSLELAETPYQAKVFLGYDRETKYKNFIAVMGSVKAAYKELWDIEAMSRFNKHYFQLTKSEKQFIRDLIPFGLEVNQHSWCGPLF